VRRYLKKILGNNQEMFPFRAQSQVEIAKMCPICKTDSPGFHTELRATGRETLARLTGIFATLPSDRINPSTSWRLNRNFLPDAEQGQKNMGQRSLEFCSDRD
jgi:hypothetical protein